jgi:hypothetical protein
MASMVIIDSQNNFMTTAFLVVYVGMATGYYSMAAHMVLKCQRMAFK